MMTQAMNHHRKSQIKSPTRHPSSQQIIENRLREQRATHLQPRARDQVRKTKTHQTIPRPMDRAHQDPHIFRAAREVPRDQANHHFQASQTHPYQ